MTTPCLLLDSSKTNQRSADADAVPREDSATRDGDLMLHQDGDHIDLPDAVDAVEDSSEPLTMPVASTIDAPRTTAAEEHMTLLTDARKIDPTEAHTVPVVSGEVKTDAWTSRTAAQTSVERLTSAVNAKDNLVNAITSETLFHCAEPSHMKKIPQKILFQKPAMLSCY